MNADAYEKNYELARKGGALIDGKLTLLNGGGSDRVWGSMTYACIGRNHGDEFDLPPCGHEQRYYLGFGVEGPRPLRESFSRQMEALGAESAAVSADPADFAALLDKVVGGGTIPAPFVAGSCPKCHGGSMQHVRFPEDEDFAAGSTDSVVLRDPPSGARYFRVPDAPLATYNARERGYGGAELVMAP